MSSEFHPLSSSSLAMSLIAGYVDITGSQASSAPKPTSDALPTPATSGPSEAEIQSAHSALNAQLAKLHAFLPPLTALIIFTGHSDPRLMSTLSAKKAKFDKLWKTVKQSEIKQEDRWMESDDRRLVDEVERCRFGLSFYCVKA